MATVPVEQRDVYTIPEISRRLGWGMRQTYEAARRGTIPVLVLGERRYVVPKVRFERWLAGEAADTDGDAKPTAA